MYSMIGRNILRKKNQRNDDEFSFIRYKYFLEGGRNHEDVFGFLCGSLR